MPSHQKARTSPKKKKGKGSAAGDGGRHKESYSAEQLVQAADHAAHVQDPIQALNLYTAAAQKAASTSADDKNPELLVDILEKRAAVKVSLEDPDGALADYQECANLIRLPASLDINNNDSDHENTQASSAFDISRVERKAGLYLYMGQLSEGQDALDVYRQAIDLLERVLQMRSNSKKDGDDADDKMQTTCINENNDDDDEAVRETRRNLAAAYCTAAELYLTDLCYEEDAEQACETYLQQALKLTTNDDDDETNNAGEPDVLQTLASLRLSQNRGMEAVEHILSAYQTMREGCEALSSLVGMRENNNNNNAQAEDQATELLATEAVQRLPGFEFRCQTAKLLLECASVLKDTKKESGESNQNEDRGDDGDDDDNQRNPRESKCLRASMDVLGSLLAENDEVIEIWILAGDASAALKPTSPELPSHYWERAIEMLNAVKSSLEEQLGETADEEEEEQLNQELEEVLCQMESTKSKLDEIGATMQED